MPNKTAYIGLRAEESLQAKPLVYDSYRIQYC